MLRSLKLGDFAKLPCSEACLSQPIDVVLLRDEAVGRAKEDKLVEEVDLTDKLPVGARGAEANADSMLLSCRIVEICDALLASDDSELTDARLRKLLKDLFSRLPVVDGAGTACFGGEAGARSGSRRCLGSSFLGLPWTRRGFAASFRLSSEPCGCMGCTKTVASTFGVGTGTGPDSFCIDGVLLMTG